MTDQEYFERRKPLADSISFDSDDDKPITRKDLKILCKDIEGMFNSMHKSIAEQIRDHKEDCELCTAKYLLKDDCQDIWEKCHKIHSDKQMQTINKYWEIGKKIAIAIALIAGGGSLSSIIEAIKGL